ncbi:MAG TPA: hypothetical protein VL485_14100 [Ktedonobacteraceae bacterium]|nr:hypothetical protein [Ktedonobacteraceae bacterium]
MRQEAAEELCQRMLYEMQQPDFAATWNLVTAWGRQQCRSPGDWHNACQEACSQAS